MGAGDIVEIPERQTGIGDAGGTSRRGTLDESSPRWRGRATVPKLTHKEVHLTPEQQHQLAELAAQRGCDPDALAQEAISRYLAEEARFVEAVKLGEAALERGEYLTYDQVGKRLDRLFKS
jgi:predicted transcriptional regulator